MHNYVIRAEDLRLLNELPPDHPRPVGLEWINCGTDQRLRRSTVEMLLRTLYRRTDTPSVCRLHNSSGLRLRFRSEDERQRFAARFGRLRGQGQGRG